MSKIEWTHRPGTKSEVLNPTTGCDKVSAGCRGCYAEVMHKRLTGMGQPKYQQPFLGGAKFWPDELSKPFKWRKPRTVFLNSMSDIFHKDITVQQIAQIYAMMFLTQWHTYIVLTKRSDRAAVLLVSQEFWDHYVDAVNNLPYESVWSTKVWSDEELHGRWPLRNVWQGVSVENQETFDDRVDQLFLTPSHIRVVSIEPQIGPINMFRMFESNEFNNFWIINGGESGNKARPPHPDWFRQIRDQCKYAGIPYFFKQHGAWQTIDTHRIDQAVSKVGYFDSDQKFIECKNWKYLPHDIGKIPSDLRIPMTMVGKHESGNYLDGVQHLEFPA